MEDIKKDVWLSIHSVQRFEGCEPEEVNMMTAARLYRKRDKYYISYHESEITGLEGTHTMLKIDKGAVSMTRTGSCPSEMLFLENQRHVGLYHTNFGTALTISTRTSRIVNRITENGGMLAIDYTIEVDQNLAGQHHFEMVVSTEPMV